MTHDPLPTTAATTEPAPHPLTAGELRKALDGLPDEAQVFVNVSGHMPDYAVEYAWQSQQIPWSHHCDESDTEHRPGRDCPKVIGLEIHAIEHEELDNADA